MNQQGRGFVVPREAVVGRTGPFDDGQAQVVTVQNTVSADITSIPLPPDAATQTGLTTINTTLGSPAQQPSVVTYTHSSASVGTGSSGEVLAANSSAKYRMFQNVSMFVVTIAFGTTAVAGTQIVLSQGDRFECSLVGGNMDTRAVNAIAAGGTCQLNIVEAA